MKKIMFNDQYGLTRAVLEKQKTMTRRTVKTPRDMTHDFWNPIIGIDNNGRVHFTVDCADGTRRDLYPQYQIGEVVAVAQCYEDVILDVGEEKWNKIHPWNCIEILCTKKGLHNKMFVRADLMPHRIRITDIKVERLKDISREDSLKEGVEVCATPGDALQTYYVPGLYAKGLEDERILDVFLSPFDAFATLIDRVSGRGTWGRNPWVFAYTFELIETK